MEPLVPDRGDGAGSAAVVTKEHMLNLMKRQHQELSSVKGELERSKQGGAELQRQVEELRRQVQEEQRKAGQMGTQLSASETEMQRLENQVQEQAREMESSKSDGPRLQEELAQSHSLVSQLKLACKEHEQAKDAALQAKLLAIKELDQIRKELEECKRASAVQASGNGNQVGESEKALQVEVEQLKIQLAGVSNEMKEAQRRHAEREQALKAQVDQAQDATKQSQVAAENLRSQLGSCQEELKTQAAKYTVEEASLRGLLTASKAQLEKSNQDVASLRVQIDELQKGAQGRVGEREEHERLVAELQSKLAQLQVDKENEQIVLAERDSLLDRVKELEAGAATNEQSELELRAQVDQVTAKAEAEAASMRADLDALTEKLVQSKRDVQESQAEAEVVRKELDEKTRSEEKLSNELSMAMEGRKGLEEAEKLLRSDLDGLTEKLVDAERRITEKDANIEQLHGDVEAQREACTQLGEKEKAWGEERQALSQALKVREEGLAQAKSQLEALEKSNQAAVDALQEQLRHEVEAKSTLKNDVDRLNAEINEQAQALEAQGKAAQASHAEKQAQLEERASKAEELAHLNEMKAADLAKQLAQATNQHQALQTRLDQEKKTRRDSASLATGSEWQELKDSGPVPPYGIESPEIQTVFQSWSMDKQKVAQLNRFCQTIVKTREVPRQRNLEITNLDEHVAAGFTHLVGPVLKHSRNDLDIKILTKRTWAVRIKIDAKQRAPDSQ